jgi:hypothetical protein
MAATPFTWTVVPDSFTVPVTFTVVPSNSEPCSGELIVTLIGCVMTAFDVADAMAFETVSVTVNLTLNVPAFV